MTEDRHTNLDGLEIIKVFEGLKLNAYKCPAGVWTIGYGHTNNVIPGMKINVEQALNFLSEDVKSAEMAVYDLVTVPLNDNQFSALVSFVFNVGRGKFSGSTMRKLLNKGDYRNAAEEFGKWIYSNGKILNGLVARRKREKDLFLK